MKKFLSMLLSMLMVFQIVTPTFALAESRTTYEYYEEEFDVLTRQLMEAELNDNLVIAEQIKSKMDDANIELLSAEDLTSFLFQTNTPVPYILLPETTDNVTWTKRQYNSYEASNSGLYKVIHLRATPRNNSSRLRMEDAINLSKTFNLDNLAESFVLAAAGMYNYTAPILTVSTLLSDIHKSISGIQRLSFNSISLVYKVDQICDYYYVLPADDPTESYMITLNKNSCSADYSGCYGVSYWIGTDEDAYTGAFGPISKTYTPSTYADLDTACLLYEQGRTRTYTVDDIALELVQERQYTLTIDFPPNPFAVW